MGQLGDISATHNTAPAFLIFAIQNGDHDLSSGSDVDLGPLERVGVVITKVDTESQHHHVSNRSKVGSLGGHVQRIVTGLVGSNNDNIVGTTGLSPCEGRRLAL